MKSESITAMQRPAWVVCLLPWRLCPVPFPWGDAVAVHSPWSATCPVLFSISPCLVSSSCESRDSPVLWGQVCCLWLQYEASPFVSPGQHPTWAECSVHIVETRPWRKCLWQSATTGPCACTSPATRRCWTPGDSGWAASPTPLTAEPGTGEARPLGPGSKGTERTSNSSFLRDSCWKLVIKAPRQMGKCSLVCVFWGGCWLMRND